MVRWGIVTPEELRTARQSFGLSQEALAKLMGISPNTVARWERGERPIHQGQVRLAFKVLRLKAKLGHGESGSGAVG